MDNPSVEIHKISDKCGVLAIVDNHNVFDDIVKGLSLLQHRGQESAGISYMQNGTLITFKKLGLVSNVFKDHTIINTHMSIGHVRY